MPKDVQQERYRWLKSIINKELRICDVVKICPHSERSLKRWLKEYRAHGVEGLKPKSTAPKTQPGETPVWIKEKVIKIRKDTKKCALKIHWQLEKEGIFLHERTIGKLLKKESLVRKYRTKKIKYKYIKAERQPGELMEIDVKYIPGKLKTNDIFNTRPLIQLPDGDIWKYLMNNQLIIQLSFLE